jgi:hypothetical protein
MNTLKNVLKGFLSVIGTIIFLSVVIWLTVKLPFNVGLYVVVFTVTILIILAISTELHDWKKLYFYTVVWLFLISYGGIGLYKILHFTPVSKAVSVYKMSDYDYAIESKDGSEGGFILYLIKDDKVVRSFEMNNKTFLESKDKIKDLTITTFRENTRYNQFIEGTHTFELPKDKK